MKEILAFIRMNKIGITKKMLADSGFPGMTVVSSRGRGKHAVKEEAIKILMETEGELPANEIGAHLSEAFRLTSRRTIWIIVDDEQAAECVDIIIKANQTGNPGDGRIFVTTITDSWNVRTGEQLCCEAISK